MSCVYDIYEAFKDLFVDCIFCTEEKEKPKTHRRPTKKYKNKATQTNFNLEEIKEPGS